MPDLALRSEIARAVKEAHQIMAQMRTMTVANGRAEEQSRAAIRESRALLLFPLDGDVR